METDVQAQRAAWFAEKAAAVEKALVERREVSRERAAMYVNQARNQVNVQDREMWLMWLAMDFKLTDVMAE